MARAPADVRLFYEALTGRRRRDPRSRGSGSAPTCICARSSRPSSAPSTHAVARAGGLDRARPSRRPTASIRPSPRSRTSRPRWPTPTSTPPARTSTARTSRARLARAGKVTIGDYVEATARASAIRAGFARLFAATDLLLTPIHSGPARAFEATRRSRFRDGVLPFTVPQDLAGLPSCAVPVGFDDLGLPVGVQLTGPPWSEGRVLAAAEELFSATASARAGSASSPVICGIRIPSSSMKHQHQSSPGSSERMIGWLGRARVRGRVLVRASRRSSRRGRSRGRSAGAASAAGRQAVLAAGDLLGQLGDLDRVQMGAVASLRGVLHGQPDVERRAAAAGVDVERAAVALLHDAPRGVQADARAAARGAWW